MEYEGEFLANERDHHEEEGEEDMECDGEFHANEHDHHEEEEEEDSLNSICAIIDMECFYVRNEYVVRELAIAPMDRIDPYWKLFNLCDIRKEELTEKDWSTIRYCSKFVHGLSFYPLPGERSLSHKVVDRYVLGIYETLQTPEKFVMAYKGGTVERNLLRKLDIPSVNLELYGCPKYAPDDYKTCGYHVKARSPTIHCPIYEVLFFKEWLLSQ